MQTVEPTIRMNARQHFSLNKIAALVESYVKPSGSFDPVCSPSRSALSTGRMASETGVIHNNIGIDREVPNLGQWFEQNADYARVYCGKWYAAGAGNYPDVSRARAGYALLHILLRRAATLGDALLNQPNHAVCNQKVWMGGVDSPCATQSFETRRFSRA